jgi:GNAT superfamily N-acetyltransferase
VGAVKDIARDAGCRRLWVVTTNDNLDALRFYQRRGFRLRLIRPGAVDRSRELLKPEIPTTGTFGIPLRDEIELEMSW